MDLVEFWEHEVLPRLNAEIYEGVSWKSRGTRFWRGPCPLHGGKEANFSVDCTTLRWRCFSKCGSGSLFAFLNGGQEPRGETWVQTLRNLAKFAGVSFPERALSPEGMARIEGDNRRAHLLETGAAFCARALLEPANEAARPVRDYLEGRGFLAQSWADLPLGVFPARDELRAHLSERGFSKEEIAASGLVRDGRFEGRLLITWRDSRGRIGTFAARDVSDERRNNDNESKGNAPPKYLYFAREEGWAKSKSELVAFGLDTALPALRRSGEPLLLVEGLLDVLTLQTRGFLCVAAIGGNGREMNAERLVALAGLGARRVTVCLDNDPKPGGQWPGREGALHIAGLAATRGNIQNVDKGNVLDVYVNVPVVDVLPPEWLGDFKDVDAFVRARGLDAFERLLPERQSAATFLVEDVFGRRRFAGHLALVTRSGAARRGAVESLLALDARLNGPRAPLDREEIGRLAGERSGFSSEALAQITNERARVEREQSRKRALESWLRDATRETGTTPADEVEGLIARLASEVSGLRTSAKTLPPPFSVARLDEESCRQPRGKASGWAALDALGVRFGAGEFALVGARTGHGKTSFLVALLSRWLELGADWLELGADETLLFFSLEEPELRIYHRLLSFQTALEAGKREHKTSGWTVPHCPVPQVRDWTRDPSVRGESYGWPDPQLLSQARRTLGQWEGRLQIVWGSEWTLDDIEAYARSMSKKRPLGGVFVDYLQRVPPPSSGRFERRDQEVSAIGRRFKTLASDITAPVIAGAQINREAIPEGYSRQMNSVKTYAEARKHTQNARPELHHLREGGSEQEADLALGLLSYGADYRLKNRNGEPGKWATLAFEGRFGLVRDPDKDEDI